ncbi:adenylate cyclase [Enhydrobacter aerosaccus]|uniref:Adenylate cyclase n=1 Tax=Enhydrobacter aerosaccus TaxID=225324 RepID=A0A1T4N871_9HYPH|nr:adenylate/guanylate cyclase domain-containing protein [Enhydrobacter aerosaccus]SJZ75296.1 adenylate cyclase [Enhydrobacter aerosaccus]
MGNSLAGADEVAAWLIDAGLRNLPPEELVDGFARRLNAIGVVVARIFVGGNTLHPLVRARSMIWDRETGPSTHFVFQHGEIDDPVLRQSPFMAMLRDGLAARGHDLCQPPKEDELPVFAELRDAGMTEWQGRIFPFGELMPEARGPDEAEPANRLWMASSFTTDRRGGYSEADRQILDQLLPLFALAAKAATTRLMGEALLASYLGSDPAARILSGSVRRGTVQSVEAAVFYTDLRDFTRFADTLPGDELIALLDECFECMVRPVARRGGEVLKYLGDGLLAIFPTASRGPDETCALALTAAAEALYLMEMLTEKRAATGKATPGLDIALHVGTVQYGNVGADARLDFTVIGPAVNESSRIELLCKELGHNLLVSQSFTAAADRSRPHLISVGRHRLRGVREETELFTLAE